MITPKEEQEPEHVADHYDDLDRWYMAIWGEHVHHGLWLSGNESVDEATRNLSTRLAEAIKVQGGERLCDIGCGYGGTSRILAQDYGAEVTGVTLSRQQWEWAQEKTDAADNPRFLHLDFFENDFENGLFDGAFSIESSEHMPDKTAFFHEVSRILKPGGRFAVYAWLAKDEPYPWEVRHLLEPICREGRLPGMGNVADYYQWLEGAGFEDVEFIDYSQNVKRTWPIIVGRMARRLTWDREAWAYLLGNHQNRIFGVTIFRIWLAYNTGSMKYGLFTASKKT